MPQKMGNGGNGLEKYDEQTGQYIKDNKPNKYYDNPEEIDFDDEIEEMIFNDISMNEEDSLEYLIFDEDDLFEEEDLEEFFEELSNENLVISEEINNLDFKELKLTLQNLESIDKSKIEDLTEEEIKNVLQAVKIIENNLIDEELKVYDTEVYVDLWPYSVKPSDYLSKKEKIQAKKDYFINDYNGVDKLEKLALLEDFEIKGEKYLIQSLKINSKYEKAKAILSKYEDVNYAYSVKRKDNAYWFKNYHESKNFFTPTTKEAIAKMGGSNSFPFKMVRYYTGSYRSFNVPLRKEVYNASNMTSYGFVKQVEGMTKAIDSSISKNDVWLQRGTDDIIDEAAGIKINWKTTQEELEQLVGKTYVDHGFASHGSNKGSGFDHKDIIINTYCPVGTKMLYVDPFSSFSGAGENETILQRGYSYKITKAEKVGSKIYLDVDVLLNSDAQKYNTEQLQELEKQYVKIYNYW